MTEKNGNKVLLGAKVDQEVSDAVKRQASKETRTVSFIVNRLLRKALGLKGSKG